MERDRRQLPSPPAASSPPAPAGRLFDEMPLGSGKKLCSNDLLSQLPAPLLHHILSFLPAQEVVRTSVLSWRWVHLWTFAPCLNIDIEDFDMDKKRFFKFVEHLLLLREAAPLDKFRIRSFETEQAILWIRHALQRRVRVLEFAEHDDNDIFDDFDFSEIGPISFFSPYLKSLVITNIVLYPCHIMTLECVCPVLENLELRKCYMDATEISSSTLKNLDIFRCFIDSDLLIYTPSLVTLCLSYPDYNVPSFKNLSSLLTASIILYNHCPRPYYDGVEIEEEGLCDDEDEVEGKYNILGGLSHAKSLELLAIVGEVVLEMELRRFPMFNNLTGLSLGQWCTDFEFYPLVCFLRHAPKLEKLTLALDTMERIELEEIEETFFPKDRSFTSDHLKRVTINCLKDDERVDKLVALLRQNAAHIEEINIKQSLRYRWPI